MFGNTVGKGIYIYNSQLVSRRLRAVSRTVQSVVVVHNWYNAGLVRYRRTVWRLVTSLEAGTTLVGDMRCRLCIGE